MSKPWGNIGTWAAEAEREEEEMEAAAAASSVAAAAAAPANSQSFPSLRESVTAKPKKKKMSLNEFYSVSSATLNRPVASKGLTPDEMLRLPTGPRERDPDEMQYGTRGFSSYGRSGGPPPGRNRDDFNDGGSWGGGGGERRQYGGGYDDERRGPPRVSDFDQPSRADEADNWAMGKKALPSMDSGRQSRYASLGSGSGGGMGGASRADDVDNWASGKKPAAAPSRPSNFGSGFRTSGPEPDRWTRGEGIRELEATERPRLVLNPPKSDVAAVTDSPTEAIKTNKPSPFGAARPREQVLAEKGLDWRKLENDIETKKTSSQSSRPTSAHSSRPSSAHSSRSEAAPAGLLQQGLENLARPARPKVNPFGDAKPREVLLQERGQDWRKIDRDLEHRSIDRPETEEEKLLKEEINQLKQELQKEASVEENKEPAPVSDGNDQSSLRDVISQKEKELETLTRELDDKLRFAQKPHFERPGSGAGRTGGFYDNRPPSRTGSVDESRNAEFIDRPRSRGAQDINTRPVDERRSYQGGRERGFLGSRDFDRPRSRDRW
ncbi:unnamed protein product [Linum tenue]|uniref:Uncharacterized protein n=1 Tax=Linum tenue TaxID=586396 RepID=A0AAV0I274_9ROSI|nr:unnamed protein product [Linum tenue]